MGENAYWAERREPQLSLNGRLQLQGAWQTTEGRELGREPIGISDHFAGRRGNLLLSGRQLASVKHVTVLTRHLLNDGDRRDCRRGRPALGVQTSQYRSFSGHPGSLPRRRGGLSKGAGSAANGDPANGAKYHVEGTHDADAEKRM